MNFFKVILVIIVFFSNIAHADIIKAPTTTNTFNEKQFLQQLSNNVERLLAEKKNTQAIELAKASTLKAPQSAKVQFFYVSLLVFLEHKQQAIQQLALLKKRFPNNGNAFFMAGVLQWQEGESERAIADMTIATELAPAELKYWLMLSQMNHDGEGHGLNVHKGSLQALLSAEKHHPNNVDLLYRIAATYDEESKSDQALEYYSRVLALDPAHNNANTSSAINSLKVDNKANISKWAKATKSITHRTYINGIKLIYQNRFQEAFDLLKNIQSELPKNGHLDYYLAKANLGLDKNDQAVIFASSAINKGTFPSEQNEMIALITSLKPPTLSFKVHKISNKGVEESIGNIDVIELSKGIVIKPTLAGLSPGSHGFHVHQEGTCDNIMVDGQSMTGGMAKGHYMGHQHHGAPAGDLPNIVFDKQATANQAFFAPQLTFSEVKGRSFMIHALAKNDANLRIACGVAK